MNEVEMTEYIGECLNYKRGWRGIKAMIGCKYVAPKKAFDTPVKSNNIGCQFDFKLNRRYNTCQVIYDRGIG